KKYLLLLCSILGLVFLSSCGNGKDEKTIKVMMPEGAPTLGLVKMMHDNEKILNKKIEYTVTKANLISTAFTSKSHEIIVAPTNVGAKLYSVNPDYVYAGTLTLGNLFLVSRNEMTAEDLEGRTIYAFGQGSIPEIVLRKVLGDLNVNIEFQDI